MSKLQIYHAPHTRGIRVIWLCEELGLDYEVQPIDFSPSYRASAEWRALNPVGKVPVLRDGETVMFESCAIMDYIIERYGEGRLKPAVSSTEFSQYLQWHWFAESTFARPLGEIVNHGREFPDEARIPEVVNEMQDRAVSCMHAVSEHLETREYLTGDAFCAADISMGYTLHLVDLLLDVQWPPLLHSYWLRLKARPGCAKALAA